MDILIPRFFQQRRLKIELSVSPNDVLCGGNNSINVPIDVEFGAVLRLRLDGYTFQAWIDRRPFRRWKSPMYSGAVMRAGGMVVFDGVFKISRFEAISSLVFGIFSIGTILSIAFRFNRIEDPGINISMIGGLTGYMYVYLSYTFERDFRRIKEALSRLNHRQATAR